MGLFNKIKSSVQQTTKAVEKSNSVVKSTLNNVGSTIKAEVKKTELITGLQSATKIGLGVVELGLSVVPGGAAANKAINLSLAAGNGKSGGQVNAWTGIGDTNSTLNMVPGGLLAQNIASVATKGQSNSTLSKFVPDPKRMIMNGGKSVGTTLLTHPSQTVNTIKSVATSNVATLNAIPVVHTLGQSAQTIVNPMIQSAKPSIQSLIAPSTIGGTLAINNMSKSNIRDRLPPTPIGGLWMNRGSGQFVPNIPSTLTAPIKATVAPMVTVLSHTLEKKETTPTISAPEEKPTVLEAFVEVVTPMVDSETAPPTSTLSLSNSRQESLEPPSQAIVVSHNSSIFDFCTIS